MTMALLFYIFLVQYFLWFLTRIIILPKMFTALHCICSYIQPAFEPPHLVCLILQLPLRIVTHPLIFYLGSNTSRNPSVWLWVWNGGLLLRSSPASVQTNPGGWSPWWWKPLDRLIGTIIGQQKGWRVIIRTFGCKNRRGHKILSHCSILLISLQRLLGGLGFDALRVPPCITNVRSLPLCQEVTWCFSLEKCNFTLLRHGWCV